MAKGKSSDAGIESVNDAIGSGEPENANSAIVGNISGIEIASPTSATGAGVGGSGSTDSGSSGTAKRGRGRPPGSGKSKPQKVAPVSVKGIEQLLFTIHLGLVKITGVDELEIDKEEAKLLSEAVTEVSSHYNVIVDPKTVAWLGLLGVCGTVYGPRFGAYKLRKQMEKESKTKDEGNVVQMPNTFSS